MRVFEGEDHERSYPNDTTESSRLGGTVAGRCVLDDVIEEARFLRAVELGIATADRGAFATDEEVRSAFAQWGVKV